jgi:predicted ribosome quality control (RQC) complex YloA/Tae2 family protein
MVHYKDCDQNKKISFNEAIDEYFTKIRNAGEKRDATKDYSEEVRRLERVIEKQQNTLDELDGEAEKFKEMGDTIYTKYQEIENVMTAIKEAKASGSNWMRYSQENGIGIIDPAARKIEVEGIGILIDKSITDNANRYYEKAKKVKSKMEGAQIALVQSKKELKYVIERKIKVEKRLPEGPVERYKPEWYEKFRWFKSSEGFLAIGGKDAETNEILIKSHLEPNDLVFHSTVHGAPFFIVKNPEGVEIPKQTMQETAEAAASYSSAWGSGWGNADVYAVKPDQVSKTPNSGEYLSKGAFVIRGERKWFKNVPLKVAIGFRIDEYAIAIGGPEGAVASQVKHYVKVGPGTIKSGQLSKDIRLLILRQTNKEEGQMIKKVVINEIQKWIPSGKGMVMK